MAVAILAGLLFVAFVSLVILWERARLPLYDEADRPLIDRSVQRAAQQWSTDPREVRRRTFPIVMRFGPRACVELRPRSNSGPHGGPHYLACYEGAASEPDEERISVF